MPVYSFFSLLGRNRFSGFCLSVASVAALFFLAPQTAAAIEVGSVSNIIGGYYLEGSVQWLASYRDDSCDFLLSSDWPKSNGVPVTKSNKLIDLSDFSTVKSSSHSGQILCNWSSPEHELLPGAFAVPVVGAFNWNFWSLLSEADVGKAYRTFIYSDSNQTGSSLYYDWILDSWNSTTNTGIPRAMPGAWLPPDDFEFSPDPMEDILSEMGSICDGLTGTLIGDFGGSVLCNAAVSIFMAPVNLVGGVLQSGYQVLVSRAPFSYFFQIVDIMKGGEASTFSYTLTLPFGVEESFSPSEMLSFASNEQKALIRVIIQSGLAFLTFIFLRGTLRKYFGYS